MYINKAMLIGNITKDPELKTLPSGTKVVSFSLATNRTWKDQNGARQEATEYHNIVAFAKPAELIAQYMKKGSTMYVEGRLQTRSWQSQDGQTRYRTEIVLENFQFGPKPGATGYSAPLGTVGPAVKGKPKADESEKDQGLESIEYPDENINAEDIPF